jgi:hypothetical protein
LRNSLRWLLFVFLILSDVAFAQGAPSPVPSVPGPTVPAWVFYWVLGITSAGTVIWMGVTKILWDRGNKSTMLSEDEKGWLRQLYHWHKPVDEDQVPLWYTPRSLIEYLQTHRDDHIAIKALLTKLVEQNDDINDDLRTQIKERLELYDRQQNKMLMLAVRVQRAVEALARLGAPDVESTLGDMGKEDTP